MRKIARRISRSLHTVEWAVSLGEWRKANLRWIMVPIVTALAGLSWQDVFPWLVTGLVALGWVLTFLRLERNSGGGAGEPGEPLEGRMRETQKGAAPEGETTPEEEATQALVAELLRRGEERDRQRRWRP